MSARSVVILGAGTGGVVVGRCLRRHLRADDRIVLVERSSVLRFAPSFLWVMSGARRPEQLSRALDRQRRKGLEVLRADVLEIDPGRRLVKTSETALGFDQLVIALGAELAPEVVPGFGEAAHDLYTLEGAVSAGAALRQFDGGRIVVMVSRMPYKCPAAPYEAAFLTEALLRRRGRRDQSTIDIYTPEPFPMPTAGPVLGDALSRMLEERGIGLHTKRTVDRIDVQARELVLDDNERVAYDLLLGVPAHRAPTVVQDTSLAGPTGFIPVERSTLEADAEGVFAIGDVSSIPLAGNLFLPKAGVFAHAEAEVVARRIAAELAGRPQKATFDGTGACFVEMGDGIGAYATGDFYAANAPQVQLRRPRRRWHLAKVAFEQYWLRRWF